MIGRHSANAQATATGGTSGSVPGTGPGATRREWKHRAIMAALVLAGLVLSYVMFTAYIPRWWSQRIGHAVSGQLSTGVLLGFCFGAVFTIVPLGLLWIVMRRSMAWKARIVWLLLVLVLAAPNLMTLGVAIGGGSGAHAGQRTMDVDAPMFRGATLAGAAVAVIVFLVLVIVYRRRPKGPKPAKTS